MIQDIPGLQGTPFTIELTQDMYQPELDNISLVDRMRPLQDEYNRNSNRILRLLNSEAVVGYNEESDSWTWSIPESYYIRRQYENDVLNVGWAICNGDLIYPRNEVLGHYDQWGIPIDNTKQDKKDFDKITKNLPF